MSLSSTQNELAHSTGANSVPGGSPGDVSFEVLRNHISGIIGETDVQVCFEDKVNFMEICHNDILYDKDKAYIFL
jgi:hypothetical protein